MLEKFTSLGYDHVDASHSAVSSSSSSSISSSSIVVVKQNTVHNNDNRSRLLCIIPVADPEFHNGGGGRSRGMGLGGAVPPQKKLNFT